MMRPHLLVMARFRGRGLALRPINSVKNIVDSTNLGVVAATVTDITLVDAVNDYSGASATVPIGCKVSSIYLFQQIISADSGVANADWYIWKGPNAVAAAMPVPGATGGHALRKYILHEEKGIPGNALDGAYPLTFKGVIKIPRGRQRMAEADKVILKIRSADLYNACTKAIYKFYQ